jgi:hypothetical protein
MSVPYPIKLQLLKYKFPRWPKLVPYVAITG